MAVDGFWYRENNGIFPEYHFLVYKDKASICGKHIRGEFRLLEHEDWNGIEDYGFCHVCKQESPINPNEIIQEEQYMEDVKEL